MTSLLGIVLVIAAVVGGYLLEHGELLVLWQPAEFVIILGAAAGTIIAANPMRVVLSIIKGAGSAFQGDRVSSVTYLQTLKMLFELFTTARKGDDATLEREVDNPKESPVLSKYPEFLKESHALAFLCDTLRTHVTGGVTPFDLNEIMQHDIDIQHSGAMKPAGALQTVAESLPGLGIVAAVLGVVITMGALGGPPEEIGHKVAAALVGTFLGILMCYGIIGPIANKLVARHEEEQQFLECLRNGILGFVRGAPPVVAVELARRSIPLHVRPEFAACEAALRGADQGSAQ